MNFGYSLTFGLFLSLYLMGDELREPNGCIFNVYFKFVKFILFRMLQGSIGDYFYKTGVCKEGVFKLYGESHPFKILYLPSFIISLNSSLSITNCELLEKHILYIEYKIQIELYRTHIMSRTHTPSGRYTNMGLFLFSGLLMRKTK